MKAWMVTKMRTVKWLGLSSRGNPQRFVNHQSPESDCEDSEVVEPTVKRKPPKGLDTMSMED